MWTGGTWTLSYLYCQNHTGHTSTVCFKKIKKIEDRSVRNTQIRYGPKKRWGSEKGKGGKEKRRRAKNYLAKNDGHKEGPEKVVSHLKELAEHGVREGQLCDHQQRLLRIKEAAKVTMATVRIENTNRSPVGCHDDLSVCTINMWFTFKCKLYIIIYMSKNTFKCKIFKCKMSNKMFYINIFN